MSGEKVIYNLLSSNVSLTASVPVARIYAGLVPLDTTLPCIAYNHISTVEDTTIGLTSYVNRSRIQITIASKTYAELKSIVNLVTTACNHKQGTFNGVRTDSVILDIAGADFRDDESQVFYQTIDFIINYH